MRNELLIAAACMLDIGVANAQMSVAPPPQPDATSLCVASGVIGACGTDSNTHTYSGTAKYPGTIYLSGSIHLGNGATTTNTGSAICTLTTGNPVWLDEGTGTTASWKVVASGGNFGCYSNDSATAKVITSTTGSFLVAGATSLSETISAGAHLCAQYDGTFWASEY